MYYLKSELLQGCLTVLYIYIMFLSEQILCHSLRSKLLIVLTFLHLDAEKREVLQSDTN
jgi:hypothetical protein